jgi:hypothetical protein
MSGFALACNAVAVGDGLQLIHASLHPGRSGLLTVAYIAIMVSVVYVIVRGWLAFAAFARWTWRNWRVMPTSPGDGLRRPYVFWNPVLWQRSRWYRLEYIEQNAIAVFGLCLAALISSSDYCASPAHEFGPCVPTIGALFAPGVATYNFFYVRSNSVDEASR